MDYNIRMYIDIFQSVDSLILLYVQSLVGISKKTYIWERREYIFLKFAMYLRQFFAYFCHLVNIFLRIYVRLIHACTRKRKPPYVGLVIKIRECLIKASFNALSLRFVLSATLSLQEKTSSIAILCTNNAQLPLCHTRACPCNFLRRTAV